METDPHLFDISEELNFLVRGFFSTPAITALGRIGALEIMLVKDTFTPHDFAAVTNKNLLQNVFQYLARIGLLINHQEKTWQVSELGRQIFQRSSSFYVPHSYHAYMDDLSGQLTGKTSLTPSVDRAENVIGSGKTHLRYFPLATSFLKRRTQFDVIVDIGCGDGKFLSTVLKAVPGKAAIGIDNSPVSVQMTQENLRHEHPGREIDILCSDAADTTDWGQKLKQIVRSRRLAISMWFLIHEISQKDPGRIIAFLKNVHHLFPEACLIICEIVRHESEVLAKHCKKSLMPEYLFFHDVSNQGVLSWTEYHQILQSIPYQIECERLFDAIYGDKGGAIPSSFIWHLVPKREG